MTTDETTITLTSQIHNVNIQTRMRPLTSSEISRLSQEQEAYDAWQEAVDLGKKLFGERVHTVIVSYDSEYSDKGSRSTWPNGIKAQDQEGKHLSYNFNAPFWHEPVSTGRKTPYEEIAERVKAWEDVAWNDDRKDRIGRLVVRNRERLNEQVVMPFYEGKITAMPATFDFLTDLEPAPEVCPLYKEQTQEQFWNNEAEAWLETEDVCNWALGNRNDYYNHFVVDQPPKRSFPVVYVTYVTAEPESTNKKED